MGTIEMGAGHRGDEKLRPVCVSSSVGHRKKAGTGVLYDEILVIERSSVNGLSAGTVEVREVSSLEHEGWNYTVESGSLVTETHFAGAA